MQLLLVVIDDFYFGRLGGVPVETDAELVIDTNTVLSGAIYGELLQACAGKHGDIVQGLGGIEQDELDACGTF